RDGECEGAVRSRAFLDDERIRERVHAGAAVLLGDPDAEKAELREPRDDFFGKTFGFVPSERARGDLALAKISDRACEESVRLGALDLKRSPPASLFNRVSFSSRRTLFFFSPPWERPPPRTSSSSPTAKTFLPRRPATYSVRGDASSRTVWNAI